MRKKKMNVSIQIHYLANKNKVLQRGAFPLLGCKPELVALEFWRKIKKEMTVDCDLEKVICDNEDITELVKELEKAPLD
jgi:hypothetical protein